MRDFILQVVISVDVGVFFPLVYWDMRCIGFESLETLLLQRAVVCFTCVKEVSNVVLTECFC